MKALSVLLVLAAVYVAVAQVTPNGPNLHRPGPPPPPPPAPGTNPAPPAPLPGLSTRSHRSHSSSHKGSSHLKHANPALLAKKALEIFGDADGSAAFDGDKVKEDTIAEVAPKLHKKHSHSGSGKSHSHKSHSHLSGPHSHHSGSHKLSSKLKSKHEKHSGSKKDSKEEALENERHKRALFNFKDVPAGTDSIVLRKHHFSRKHHGLVAKFANSHEHTHLILVVDAFVSPRGRPSKKLGDKKKRGHKVSDAGLKGVAHKNVFIFDDKGRQLFPKEHGSHSHTGSSHHSKHLGSHLHEKLKKKAHKPVGALGHGIKPNKFGGPAPSAPHDR